MAETLVASRIGVEVQLHTDSPASLEEVIQHLTDLETVTDLIRVQTPKGWFIVEFDVIDLRRGSLTVVLASAAGGIAASRALLSLLATIQDWGTHREAARVSVAQSKAELLRTLVETRALIDAPGTSGGQRFTYERSADQLSQQLLDAEHEVLNSILNQPLDGARIVLPTKWDRPARVSPMRLSRFKMLRMMSPKRPSELEDRLTPDEFLRLQNAIKSVREVPLED